MSSLVEDLTISNGRLTILTAFDHGGEIEKAELVKLVGPGAILERWNKPIEIDLREGVGLIAAGDQKITCAAKIYTDVFIAGISIIRTEIEIRDKILFTDVLVALHSNGIIIDGIDYASFISKKISEARVRINPHYTGVYYKNTKRFILLRMKEYTPFLDQNAIKANYGEIITRFLSGEISIRPLHGKEIAEKLSHDLSYYDADLYLTSTEGVLIIGCEDYAEDLRELIELTISLFLLFHIYDWMIDFEINNAFEAIKNLSKSRFYVLTQVPRRLEMALLKVNEIRLVILDDIEDLTNPHKITSDWYYQSAYERMLNILKVREFERVVQHKIDTLHSLYSTTQDISSGRLALILEMAIVVLIAFEIIRSFLWR